MPTTEYTIVVTRTRFGYESIVEVVHSEALPLVVDLPWWRPTARGARRVAARWIRRRQRADTWRRTAKRYEL